MSKKLPQNPLAAAIGAAFVTSLAIAPVANASQNPFEATSLSSGYMQVADKHMEGKCGEGKCGGKADKAKEGKCGEGKCGAQGKAQGDGKGVDGTKMKEGKCGEGKCGGSK